ncbi:MAG: hypothetical protein E4H40_08975 [Candidatus Brocadiia bacterium]|nr:MAG: hypothetical protein E4H40_08975 [Candidatus Brocadiia bacterium]
MKHSLKSLMPVTILITAFSIGLGVEVEKAPSKSSDYLTTVKAYAETMIDKGRDTYGPVKSPLFAAALDRHKYILFSDTSRIEGIRNGDRALKGANPMHDQDLYQVLYCLSVLTGDPHYTAEADKALKWFFENCQSPETGLMAWGEHIGWDFTNETLGTARSANHEFFGQWVLWENSFKMAPEACTKFARGLWDHQIHEHSGNFSRHAQWDKHLTGTQNEYPRHGGFYIAAWAKAYQQTKDPVFLQAIETLVDYFNKNSSEKTGAIPCSTNPSRLLIMWPESNLSLAVDLWDGAEKVTPALAEKMRDRALRTDKIYLSLKHDFSPNGKGFVAGANVDTLERLTEGPWTDTAIWAIAYGKSTDSKIALLCYERYKQVKNQGYQKLIVDSAKRYLDSEPDTTITLYPGSMADAIFHMLAVCELTGDKIYLNRADYFAQKAVKIFLPDNSPLPKASSNHDHYETITGSDDLMMALLKLYAVENKPNVKLPYAYNNR